MPVIVLMLLAVGAFVSGLMIFWVSPWFAIPAALCAVAGLVVARFLDSRTVYSDEPVDEYADYYR